MDRRVESTKDAVIGWLKLLWPLILVGVIGVSLAAYFARRTPPPVRAPPPAKVE